MKKLIYLFLLFTSSLYVSGQTVYQADDIIQQINNKETVQISDAVINGDLDFTQMKKKYKGGRYGIRGGIAQEYFTRIEAPLTFANCVFTGDIITRSEVKVGREKKENFTTINAAMTFADCAFDGLVTFESIGISEVLTFRSCIFKKTLRFEHASFDKEPVLEDNVYQEKFINQNTNWDANKDRKTNHPSIADDMVSITLHNPTIRSIKIIFDEKHWNLSPFGKSGITSSVGTKIYIDGKDGKRLAMTLDKDMDTQIFDISKY
jgi:hypothetical protein